MTLAVFKIPAISLAVSRSHAVCAFGPELLLPAIGCCAICGVVGEPRSLFACVHPINIAMSKLEQRPFITRTTNLCHETSGVAKTVSVGICRILLLLEPRVCHLGE